jgi:AcrR family transcriptional regulator
MLNSVSSSSQDSPAAPGRRVRLSPEDRRRQLLGIGLSKLVERPIQELSIDEVAAEAGISRALLFHYFPTKTDYHDAVVEAAVRRVLRNVSPDPDVTGDEAVDQFLSRYFEQVDRRREFYLALVFGNGTITLGGDRVESLRVTLAGRVLAGLELRDDCQPVVHAWTAYVEDRALRWAGLERGERTPLVDEVAHCRRALSALLAA